MNKLLNLLKSEYEMTKDEVIEMCLEEFDISNMDPEEALHNLGFEPDYIFDFLDIVARS